MTFFTSTKRLVVYSLVTLELLFWHYSEITWPVADNFLERFQISLMGRRACIFLLTRLLAQIISRIFPRAYAYKLDNLANVCYLVRFKNGSKSMFRNKRDENYFVFLIVLSKYDEMSWKRPRTLTSCISFISKHIFM